jgi:hypothetical protein
MEQIPPPAMDTFSKSKTTLGSWREYSPPRSMISTGDCRKFHILGKTNTYREMRFIRPLTALDDLIGGLAAQTKSELFERRDVLDQETLYKRVYRASANALAQELRREDTILPDFIARRTDYGDRQERSHHENFWAIHLTEGALRNRLPVEKTYNWARALGFAHETVIDSVFAELREARLI